MFSREQISSSAPPPHIFSSASVSYLNVISDIFEKKFGNFWKKEKYPVRNQKI